MYTFSAQPYKKKSLNKTEALNDQTSIFMLYLMLTLLSGWYSSEQTETICLMMVVNIAITVVIHLLFMIITLGLGLLKDAIDLYHQRNLDELEKKSIQNRQQITAAYPGKFEGFEM
jgi:hypothetical protein